MPFMATAAYPCLGPDRATDDLRAEPQKIIAGACTGSPDWSTLVSEGPAKITGADGHTRFVWTASVEAGLVERHCPRL